MTRSRWIFLVMLFVLSACDQNTCNRPNGTLVEVRCGQVLFQLSNTALTSPNAMLIRDGEASSEAPPTPNTDGCYTASPAEGYYSFGSDNCTFTVNADGSLGPESD